MTTTKTERIEALNTAIKRAPGIVKFAEALSVTHQAVSQWRDKGYVPPARALAIEQKYGVPRSALMLPELVAAYLSPSSDAADVL